MNTPEPNRPGNAIDRGAALTDLYELKADLRAHTATDELQFQTIKEKLADISKVVNRMAWAGWGVAGGVLALIYHTFFR